MKRVYWVNRKGRIVLGEVLLAEGHGTDENLLQEAKDEAAKAGLDLSYGTLEIYETKPPRQVWICRSDGTLEIYEATPAEVWRRIYD